MTRDPLLPREPERTPPAGTQPSAQAHAQPVRGAGAAPRLIRRYAACSAVLRRDDFSSAQGQRLRVRGSPLPPTMLTTDPPEHTRLRAAVAVAFGSRAMSRMAPALDEVVRACATAALARIRLGEPVDLATGLAGPLSVGVVARLLGVPAGLEPDFAQWARGVAANFDPFATDEVLAQTHPPMQALLGWAADELHAGGHEGDLLAVVRAAYEDGKVSPAEALATIGLVVVGGVEPLATLVCDLLVALGAPAESAAPRPTPPPGARERAGWGRRLVEEVLRTGSPVPFTARRARCDAEVDGMVVPAGEQLVVLLGMANHDERAYPSAGQMCLDAPPTTPHLAFGAGPHTCLGAPVVRHVARSLVARLLDWPAWRVVETIPSAATVPRGYASLVVEAAGDAR